MEYCSNVLKLKQFQGAEATTKFSRLFDPLFDILNSRNSYPKGFKSAPRVENKSIWDPFLNEACGYVISLKDSHGKLLHTTHRKLDLWYFLWLSKISKAHSMI